MLHNLDLQSIWRDALHPPNNIFTDSLFSSVPLVTTPRFFRYHLGSLFSVVNGTPRDTKADLRACGGESTARVEREADLRRAGALSEFLD